MVALPKTFKGLLRVRSPWGTRAKQRVALSPDLIEGANVPGYENVRVWGDEVSQPLLASIESKDEDVRAAAKAGRSPHSLSQASFLAISGGGDQGAFAAGVLKGWARRGDRPEFEVVTGVSAGALAAPFAFIGPTWDSVLCDVHTNLGAKDLYRRRGLRGYFTDAFGDSAPMRRVIESYATDRFLDQIAEGYGNGRRLYILTTNLDAQRPVVWDLSAVAASKQPNRRTMFTKILLASSAVPGLFPPVYFKVRGADGRTYTEMHVDGGVTAQLVFIPPEAKVLEIEDKVFEKRRRRDLYVIRNSKITPEAQMTLPRALSIMARGVRTMVKYQVISDLTRLHKFARSNNTSFHYCAVPKHFEMQSDTPFDKRLAQALFACGEQVGFEAKWSSVPPDSPFREGNMSEEVTISMQEDFADASASEVSLSPPNVSREDTTTA